MSHYVQLQNKNIVSKIAKQKHVFLQKSDADAWKTSKQLTKQPPHSTKLS